MGVRQTGEIDFFGSVNLDGGDNEIYRDTDERDSGGSYMIENQTSESAPPASTVSVGHFREILIWPLLIKQSPKAGAKVQKESAVRKITALNPAWKEIEPDARVVGEYEEIVYFHPFVRDFLFGDGVTPLPIRRLGRHDVKAVHIKSEKFEKTLHVERIELYLFETEVAMLVVEIANQTISGQGIVALSLPEVMGIQDEFRRAYPPFWQSDTQHAGKCPRSVKWLAQFDSAAPLAESDFDAKEKYTKFTKTGAEPPIANHWEWLLQPLQPYRSLQDLESNSIPGIYYQQIEDERIPVMSYLALDNPRTLSQGDFIRLTFLDGWDASDTLPYSQSFLADFEKLHCVDIFWERNEEKRKGLDWLNTRYTCCGYSFTAIGKNEPNFFANAQDGALFHFRHHYFKIGLLAHFHRASLLMFAHRLAMAVKKIRSPKEDRLSTEFSDEVAAIQEDLLQFRSRYWFTEVSNQVQGTLLFSSWSDHLENQRLFEEVIDEANTVNSVLQAREQTTLTQGTARLTVVAIIGLAFSLTISLLTDDVKNNWISPALSLGLWLLLLIILIFFAGPLYSIVDKIDRSREELFRQFGSTRNKDELS